MTISRNAINAESTFVVDPGVYCECGNKATHLMEAHRTDRCTVSEPTATEFMCNVCVEKTYLLASKLLHPANDENRCRTCLLTFSQLSSIIVSLIPIPPKGRT